jgi:hypothetical protein
MLENISVKKTIQAAHLAVGSGHRDGKVLGDPTDQHYQRCHPLHTEPPSGQIQHLQTPSTLLSVKHRTS